MPSDADTPKEGSSSLSENVDLLPPSPSFVNHSFNPQTKSRSPPSSSSGSSSSAWPISYQVHSLGQRGRSPKPSPLVLSPVETKSPLHSPQSLPSQPKNPFGSPPSTPDASGSVRSFASASSSSSTSSVILPPVPASPPPVPPRNNVDLYGPPSPTHAIDPNSLNPASASDQPRHVRNHSRRVDQIPASQARTLRPNSSRGSKTPMSITPATSRPTTPKERNSFASPPVLPFASTVIAPIPGSPSASTLRLSTGTSTPNPSMHSRFSSVALRLSNYAQQDQADTLDFSGVASTLKAMEANGGYPYASVGGGSPFDKQMTLRPSRLLMGEVHKPWLKDRDWRVTASYWITFFTALIGIGMSVLVCINGYRSVPMITQPLCMVLDDNFDTLDTTVWHREVDTSGFGNGEFEMTTASPNNSFVKDGKLYIVPTLTRDVIGQEKVLGQGPNEGFIYNVTGCTNHDNPEACGAVANATKGTIINPVMSARLTTQLSRSIRYGKVEIRAKLPKGDWLWPALWMMPVDSVYGDWPRSGEIDIMEARGNSPTYPFQGLDYVRASLNWGPTLELNRAFKTFSLWFKRRSSYGDSFHTYTLEWTPDFLRVYVDSRLQRVLDLRFNVPFFNRGDFPPQIQNESQVIPLTNPWAGRGNSAPFDQRFFLIMNVAVGSTNGWFPDALGGKPWLDGSRTAARDFAESEDQWLPTWPENVEDRGMVVDYVKMWELC